MHGLVGGGLDGGRGWADQLSVPRDREGSIRDRQLARDTERESLSAEINNALPRIGLAGLASRLAPG